MAVTEKAINELIRFTQEFVRENLFSPYMGEGLTSIIRLGSELKAGAAPPIYLTGRNCH